MRSLRYQSVRASLVACMLGVMASLAVAQDPSVDVWIARRESFNTTANVLDATTSSEAWSSVKWIGWTSGAPVAQVGRFVAPQGLSDLDLEQTTFIDWDGATHTFEVASPGEVPPGFSWAFTLDLPPSRSSWAPGVTFRRSISDPVLTSDLQTRTVTLEVDVLPGALVGYDAFEVSLPEWLQLDGLARNVTQSTFDTDAFGGGYGYYNTLGDPGELSGTYTFEMEVELSRTGEMSQAQRGDLHYQPGAIARYTRQTPWTQSTGTSITQDFGDGMSAQVEAAKSTLFSHQLNDGMTELILDALATTPGASAAPESIWLGRKQRTSIAGVDVFGFSCNVEGTDLVGGRVITPGGAAYPMVWDKWDNDELDYDAESVDPEELSEFTPGLYTVEIWGDDGVVQTYSVELTGEMPSEQPVFDQVPGMTATDPRPTLSWSSPTDPEIVGCGFEIESGEFEGGRWFDASEEMSYTPAEDMPGGGALYAAGFFDIATGTVDATEGTVLGVTFYSGYVHTTDSYLNVLFPLPGDANRDGAVTDADYTIWADHYGTTSATWGEGDFNGDQLVTDADYTIWADHYGMTQTGQGVPEPVAAMWLALGAWAIRRRR
jgi:hypothetical protein